MPATNSKPALENVKEFLFRTISELGWAPPDQLEELAHKELGADSMMVHQALRFLVRQDYVTCTDGPNGRKGYEVLPPTPKARKTARYGHWSPVTRVVGTFLTHCLGPMSRPEEPTRYYLIRDASGRIIIPRSNILAMLKRAWLLLDKDEGTAAVALKRWDIAPIILPKDTPTEMVLRRVVRPDGRPTEPLLHEALVPGVRFQVSFRYPRSHFTRELVAELWDVAARSVGLSPAGGANGRWGVFLIEDIAQEMESSQGGG